MKHEHTNRVEHSHLPPADQPRVHITLDDRHFIVFDDGSMIERVTVPVSGWRSFGARKRMETNRAVRDPDLLERHPVSIVGNAHAILLCLLRSPLPQCFLSVVASC